MEEYYQAPDMAWVPPYLAPRTVDFCSRNTEGVENYCLPQQEIISESQTDPRIPHLETIKGESVG